MKSTTLFAIGSMALGMLLAGCMSEQELRDKRIAENQTLFMQLDPAARSRAQFAQIAIGDTQTAVWFAYGEPDKKTSSVSAAGTVEIWDYYTSVPQETYVLVANPPPPDPRDGRGRHHFDAFSFVIPPGYAPPPPGWHYEEDTEYVTALKRQFQFVNGLCTLINTY